VAAGPFYVRALALKNFKENVDNDANQAVLEELAGGMSSHAFIAGIALTAGGLVILADPILGTIVLTVSIAYGSCMKVYSGRLLKRRFRKSKQSTIRNIDTSNLE
jgi:hypothetical protein